MNRLPKTFRSVMAGAAIGIESALPTRRYNQDLIYGSAPLVQPLHGHAKSEAQAPPASTLAPFNRQMRRALGVDSNAAAIDAFDGNEGPLIDAVSDALAKIAAREALYGPAEEHATLRNIPH